VSAGGTLIGSVGYVPVACCVVPEGGVGREGGVGGEWGVAEGGGWWAVARVLIGALLVEPAEPDLLFVSVLMLLLPVDTPVVGLDVPVDAPVLGLDAPVDAPVLGLGVADTPVDVPEVALGVPVVTPVVVADTPVFALSIPVELVCI